MTVFGDYARYYNLIYRDKDYVGETAFILSALFREGCSPRTLLDLGCGTGRHAMEMAKKGLTVTGVDLSPAMLDMGRAELTKFQEPAVPQLLEGDARLIRLGRFYDAVTSLFHVMSYQTTCEDALAIFNTARAHLAPGGLFLFDFWFGPCVLRVRPEHRVKSLEDEFCVLRREATPSMFKEKHMINVHYDIELRDKLTGDTNRFSEEHPMRYWFLPELRELAESADFAVLKEGSWMSDRAPSERDWNAWMLVQYKGQSLHA